MTPDGWADVALLSRNADRIYWAARYLERAEDTARLVQSYGQLIDDMPSDDDPEFDRRWLPLLTASGRGVRPDDDLSETGIVRILVSDPDTPSSVAECVAAARANLRTSREILPREAWHAVNDLSMFTTTEAPRAGDRRFRDRVLTRVIDDSRRLDGILTSSMSRDAAWELWRTGRYLERADMTTRVVGVRAAGLMQTGGQDYDEVHWMGVLRSLSALQMYQRAVRGPIEASRVVQFLLFDDSFPRSVAFCLDELDRCLDRLTRPDSVRDTVAGARDSLLSTMATTNDGADLDHAMEWVQSQLRKVNDAITSRYLHVAAE